MENASTLFLITLLSVLAGVIVGTMLAGDVRNEKVALCMKNNVTLELCAAVNGWDKK